MEEKKRIAAEEIGMRIRERRQELHLSMEEVGKRLGVNKSTVQRYEAQGVDPKRKYVLSSIAQALDTTEAWLMGGSKVKERKTSVEMGTFQEDNQQETKSSNEDIFIPVEAYQAEKYLNERLNVCLRTITENADSEMDQSLLVSGLGHLLDMYEILCRHYRHAMKTIGQMDTDAQLVEMLGQYLLDADDLQERVFQREMKKPVESMKKMMDVLPHLQDKDSINPLAQMDAILEAAEKQLVKEESAQ